MADTGVDEAAFLAALREREERWAQVYEELFSKVTSIRDEAGRVFVSLDGAASVIAGPRPQPDDFPEENPCPYTFAHTRHWCGYEGCRDG